LAAKNAKDTTIRIGNGDLRVSFENTCAGTIWAIGMRLPSYRRKPVSIPFLPWMPAFAGMTNQSKKHVLAGAAISYSVDERKLMDTS
jgi:hypothetical protein